jgi:hypothetical protein
MSSLFSDLQLFNNVKQKINNEISEDEDVDVEGGFTSSNEHLSGITEHPEITLVTTLFCHLICCNYKICYIFCTAM